MKKNASVFDHKDVVYELNGDGPYLVIGILIDMNGLRYQILHGICEANFRFAEELTKEPPTPRPIRGLIKLKTKENDIPTEESTGVCFVPSIGDEV